MKKIIFLCILAVAILVAGCALAEKDSSEQQHTSGHQGCH